MQSLVFESVAPFVSPVFGDNMVLQRDALVRIWGWARPGAAVTLTLAGRRFTGDADAGGRWQIDFPGLPAGGPYDITLTGPQTRTLTNVLFGDVWICSGQSNASMGIKMCDDAQAEIAAADHPDIRLCLVSSDFRLAPAAPGDAVQSVWRVCSPDTVGQDGWGGFSAMAYYFGRSLHRALGVPIGLISNAWGGMPIEPFISGEALKALPDYSRLIGLLESQPDKAALAARIAADLDAWYGRVDPGVNATPSWAATDYDDSAWSVMQNSGRVAPGRHGPLEGATGIIWYRVTLDAPPSWADRPIMLSLSGLTDLPSVFVNGTEIARALPDAAPAASVVPSGVIAPGRNVLAIRTLCVAPGPNVYGDVSDLAASPADDPSSSVVLGALPWKYRFAVDLTTCRDQPPALLTGITPSLPSVIYNGLVAPLTPMSVKGFAWLQGESSTTRSDRYERLLMLLISDWRSRFENPTAPFLIAQISSLPGAGVTGHWAEWWVQLRDAQLQAARHVPDTALIVTTDLGQRDTHYTNKQALGERLGVAALAVAYGREGEYSGPLFQSVQVQGSKARVFFTHADGLCARDGTPTGFEIAGADNTFVPAEAAIDGQTVVVWSPLVTVPRAVRYDWSVEAAGSLRNAASLPASQFRTDSLPYLPEMRW